MKASALAGLGLRAASRAACGPVLGGAVGSTVHVSGTNGLQCVVDMELPRVLSE